MKERGRSGNLATLGIIVMLGAVAWWYDFYSKVFAVTGAGDRTTQAVKCIFVNNGECGVITSTAELFGFTPYHPMAFWIGCGLFIFSLVRR